MTEKETKAAADATETAQGQKHYTTPSLFVVGPATKLLQNAFSQRYREATSSYTTYWNN